MLRITVYTTYISVPADSEGYTLDIAGNPIPCYHIGQLLQKLKEGEYDQRQKRYVVQCKYYTYAPGRKELRLPRFMLQTLLDDLQRVNVPVDLVDGMVVTPRAVQMYLNPKWDDRNELQTAAIAFLLRSDLPMRSLSVQTGCLTGDTKINLNRGGKGYTTTLRNAYEQFNGQYHGEGRKWDLDIPTRIRSLLKERIGLNTVKDIVYSGVKPVYKVTLEDGTSLSCTADHRIMTRCGWIRASHIEGMSVMCDTPLAVGHGKKKDGKYPKIRDIHIVIHPNHPYANQYQNKKWNCYRILRHRAAYDAKINGLTLAEFLEALKDKDKAATMEFLDPKVYAVHHLNHDHCDDDPDNLVAMRHEDHQKYHGEDAYYNFGQGVPRYVKAISVEYLGEEDTYDIECEEPHHNFVANGIVVHNSGKTYCSNKAMVYRSHAALIITDGLIDQWKEALLEQTLLDEKSIYIIQGAKSIKWLWLNPDYQPAVFIASQDTLRAYALGVAEPYDIFPTYAEFLATYGIGWKTLDEFHLNFGANTQIDLRSNVEDNIYLSATPKRSSRQGKEIFDRIFPKVIRFGEEEYDKYVDIHMYGYHLNIPRPDRLMTYKGYSHPLYESQLAKPKIFEWYKDSVLCPIIHSHYLNIRRPEQKMLILVFTAAMSQVFLEHLRVEFSSLKILPFLGPDPEKNLEEADIIVSTPKSAGTGRDIKQLRTALNTVSYSSDPLARQMLGRLRKLPNGDTPVYVDTFNRNIESQVRHATNRGLIYRDLGLTYHEGTL